MSQQEIEVILTRQLATYLAMPIFVVGPDGTLVFYNEPAEAILGCRFDETGALSVDEWMRLFKATDEHGAPLPPGERPLDIRETPEFLEIAHRVREGLRAGHSYEEHT